MIKKINYSLVITLTVLTFLLTANLAWGAVMVPTQGSLLKNTIDAGSAAGYDVSRPATGLATIVGGVVKAFLSLIGILFISYAIYGGFLWMTAAGSEEKVTKAKDILRNGIIGLIVVLSAAGIYYAAAAIFDPQFANLGAF